MSWASKIEGKKKPKKSEKNIARSQSPETLQIPIS